ncbi:MAG: hypothetical protein LAT54_10195 [Cryomorphaceae bacterium]|nr:hypothetical protein [Cryomorphaceae bacterium]
MRILYLALLVFIIPTFTNAQVDMRRLPFTPEQDSLVLDSTSFSMSFSNEIKNIQIEGNFSGKMRIYGTKTHNQLNANLVYAPLLKDERAVGLQEVSAGSTDNTGVGLYIEERDGTLHIRPANNHYKDKHFSIFIPEDIALNVRGTGYGGKIIVYDLNAPIVMSQLQASVKIYNPGKEVDVSTKRNIDIIVVKPLSFPLNLTSQTGLIDVSIQKESDAQIVVTNDRVTPRIFSDLPLVLMTKEGNRQIFQLNEGVNRIEINAPFGNVYVRAFQ